MIPDSHPATVAHGETPNTDTEAEDPATLLAEARALTLAIVGGLAECDLDRVLDPVMSPIAWDLGHIAAFEDLWLVHHADGTPLLREDLADTYDASISPRSARPDLPWLHSDSAFAYLEDVRERSLASLAGQTPPSREIIELVLRHEHQHQETILQSIQLSGISWEPDLPTPFDEVDSSTAVAGGLSMVAIDGGPAAIGSGPEGFAYDNERPRHEVEVAPFAIGRTPVLNGDWQEFIDCGGYRREELWSYEGRAWLLKTGSTAPGGWREEGEWRTGRLEEIDPLRPVVHVNLHEAEAFARMHSARLPSEAEWEVAAAASGNAAANVGACARGPRRIAAGDGPLSMLGNVWEWTASDFGPYPGFRWHPYREYSEPHFGRAHRVLRGGSWATNRRVASATFRNWDLPVRRQIFSGVRIARDVD